MLINSLHRQNQAKMNFVANLCRMSLNVQVGNDQEKAQSERNSHSAPKTEVGKTKLTIRYLYLENIS